MSELSETLKQHIYPAIDAHEAKLLDSLSPRVINGDIVCACPKCSYKAVYKPRNSGVSCVSGCKKFTSLWEIMSKAGMENSAIWEKLSSLANYSPTKSVNQPTKPKKASGSNTDFYKIKDTLQDSLLHSPKALEFLEERGWKKALITQSHLGYVPSLAMVKDKLTKQGFTAEKLKTLSILDDPSLEKCIVLPWRHPNGKIKFVGINRTIKNTEYLTQKNFNKSLPKGFSSEYRQTFIIANPFHSALLNAQKVPAFTTLSVGISKEQATYLAQRKTTYHLLITNEKTEGRGAEQTCALLSSLGCKCLVTVLQKEVNQHSVQELDQLSEYALDIPKYLSRRILTSKHTEQALHQLLRQLNANDKKELKENLAMQQINIAPDIAEQLRLIANLIDLGADEQQAARTLSNKIPKQDMEALKRLLATANNQAL